FCPMMSCLFVKKSGHSAAVEKCTVTTCVRVSGQERATLEWAVGSLCSSRQPHAGSIWAKSPEGGPHVVGPLCRQQPHIPEGVHQPDAGWLRPHRSAGNWQSRQT